MTRKEIAEMIESVGVPYAYYQFPENTQQDAPFICFYNDASRDMYADNTNYQKIDHMVVELYTNNKDFDLEATLEATLNGNGLTWTRAEQYLDDEGLWVAVYDTDVIITEDQNNA